MWRPFRLRSRWAIIDRIGAGGWAIDALRSITVAQHLFGIENIVIVHHSHFGATTFTADGIIDGGALTEVVRDVPGSTCPT